VQCRTRAASSDDVRQAIIFHRIARLQEQSSILVSCDYGASRSPGLAYVLLADQYGSGHEAEALRTVLAIRSGAVPNSLVVKLGDQLLNRQGALLAPYLEYCRQLDIGL